MFNDLVLLSQETHRARQKDDYEIFKKSFLLSWLHPLQKNFVFLFFRFSTGTAQGII
jgi:hypothetical protein